MSYLFGKKSICYNINNNFLLSSCRTYLRIDFFFWNTLTDTHFPKSPCTHTSMASILLWSCSSLSRLVRLSRSLRKIITCRLQLMCIAFTIYSIVQYSRVEQSTVKYNTVMYRAVLYFAV